VELQIEERFFPEEHWLGKRVPVWAICSLVDPRTKMLKDKRGKLKDEWWKKAKQLFVEKMDEVLSKRQTEGKTPKPNRKIRKGDRGSRIRGLEDLIADLHEIDESDSIAQSPQQMKKMCQRELKAYMRLKSLAYEKCPLEWWEQHQDEYP